MKIPTATILDGFVNKNIKDICVCSYTNDADNHCAHFVCHVTELGFGKTCYAMTKEGDQSKAANIRVQEVFPQCRRVGKWGDKPADLTTGFIFTTEAGNVHLKTKTIDNVPRKHIGIFINQDVWQYKNRFRHVIKQTPAEFKQHYTGKGNYEIFYGEFPL